MSGEATELEVARIRERLAALNTERMELERVLETLERNPVFAGPFPETARFDDAPVTNRSPPTEKIALFRRLFAGRPDVFPVRWENRKTERSGYSPACGNEWVRGVCGKPKIRCSACSHQAFLPISNDVVERHLRGDLVAGVYPLLQDETCRFLAADFDGVSWIDDARAFLDTCGAMELPAALERSRSGNGGHVWMFLAEALPARTARQLGALLITETLERRPEIGFASYDRFFPNQDTMPVGGLGNLIALPLQRRPRESGNSVFVDQDLLPYDDQ